jgi:hypothetical protein
MVTVSSGTGAKTAMDVATRFSARRLVLAALVITTDLAI